MWKEKMANPQHLAILNTGVNSWNSWRRSHCDERPDLRGAELANRNLQGVNFRDANLYRASLWRADLSESDLSGADCSSVTLNGAVLCRANLSRTNLRYSRIVAANLDGAIICDAFLYGSSIWNIQGQPAEQKDLVITPKSEPRITVDDMEVAQFVFLLMRNDKIRNVLNTITTKVVLILGRFSEERLAVLNAVRSRLRELNLLPVLFDFERPNQTTVETVEALAHLARFVIADLTDARSVLQELRGIVPHRPTLAVQTVILASQDEPGMFDFFLQFPWVLGPFRYSDSQSLLQKLDSHVVSPAVAKANELQGRLRPSPQGS
jgi:uncharacterized protein YjbI with pentapeptide repeats